jgi:tripartite ATP-independent transporter DctP family solute receptor
MPSPTATRLALPSLAGALGAAVLMAAISVAAHAQETLLFHHDLPENSAQHQASVKFKELVEARSNGRYRVEIHPNNALGDDVEVAQQMQFGAVHAAPIPTAKLSNFNPSLQLIDLPFLFPSREVMYAYLDGEVGMQVLAGLRSSGFEPVMFWESGFKQMTCNHQVQGPADFSGRNVRVMESPLLMSQFRAVGGTPVPIAFSETYTALQQGVVECQENPLVSIRNMRFYEVQDYLMISNHGYLGTAFIFSKVWFDGLPADDQALMRAAVREAGQFQRQLSIETEAGHLEAIVAAGGTEVIRLTPEQIAEFQAAMLPVHQEFAGRIGTELMEATYAELTRLAEAAQ